VRPSSRLGCAILLLASCFPICSALPPAPTAPAQQPSPPPAVLSEQTKLVVVPVTVTNRLGHFVSGLTQANFQVYEDGKPQPIAMFRDADVPVTVGIVVDHSGSMGARSDDVIQGATAFVRASNPQDKEFVVNLGNTISFGLPPNVPFTSDVAQLQAALSVPSASGYTPLYDAMAAALQHFEGAPSEKKVLVLISDGGDDASTHKFSDVLRMAQTANVAIYSIGLLDPLSADQNPSVLRKFARETGGDSYFPNSASGVLSVCIAIAADIRHQYTLAYHPPDDGKTGYRKIRVAVRAPGRGRLFVRAKTGYFDSVVSPAAASDAPQGRQ
jgi:Ca-activated chloride channel family protein